MTRRPRLVVAALLPAIVGLVMTLLAGTACAHAARVSADPADNALLSSGPARVSATFNEDLQTAFAAMTVVGPDANMWATGDPEVRGNVVSVGLRPLGPVGSYVVNYRVTSADGHVVAGAWSFRLTAPGSGTPGPTTRPPSHPGDELPIWPFVLGAVILVGGGALWAQRNKP